jgi:hypothetical protein
VRNGESKLKQSTLKMIPDLSPKPDEICLPEPNQMVQDIIKENELLKCSNGGLKKELSSFKIENEKNLSLF